MPNLVQQASNWNRFSRKEIWRIDVQKLPGWKRSLLHAARIALLTNHGFKTDRLQLRSSALTFYTLLSIVPVVAMAFGIAKGFGIEKMLERELYSRFAGQQEILGQIVAFARNMLENTHGGVIAGIGVAVLFWSVIKVLTHIETAFNHIWQVTEPRSLMRRFSDYLSMMILTPILTIVASSISVFIITQIRSITASNQLLVHFSFVTYFLLELTPYVLIWLLFCLVYLVMPNTRVRISAGAVAGVVAGTVYLLMQWAYIHFQVGISHNNAIYGSFAALPLFLVWLQLSWLILLIGAELAFAIQNVDQYAFGLDGIRLSTHQRRLAALDIARLLVKRFAQAQPPMTRPQVAEELGMPLRLVNDEVEKLVACGLFVPTAVEGQREPAYLPAGDIDRYTIQFVAERLDRHGEEELALAGSRQQQQLAESLESFWKDIAGSSANRDLKEI